MTLLLSWLILQLKALRRWSNRVWVIGRKSELWYIRIYPNPGFMIPWVSIKKRPEGLKLTVKRLLWNRHDGWFTRPAGSHIRPKYGQRKG